MSLTLAQGLSAAARNGTKILDDAILGCGVMTVGPYEYFGARHDLSTKCRSWATTWRSEIGRDRPNLVVVLVGRWEVMDRWLGGRWTHVGSPDFDGYLRTQLEAAFAAAASTGQHVVFLTAPYYHRGERPDGGTWPEDDPRRVDAFNAVLADVVARHPGHATLLPFGRVTSGGGHAYVRDVAGVELRYDGVHFTSDGARWLAPWLLPQLAAAPG